jgi:hypothetical protein
MPAKTAFELYLETHPSEAHVSATKPVQYFDGEHQPEGMIDMRPKRENPDAPDSPDFAKHNGAQVPKASPATGSAPTSPDSGQVSGAPSAPVVKAPPPQPPIPTPPGQQVNPSSPPAPPSGSSKPTVKG